MSLVSRRVCRFAFGETPEFQQGAAGSRQEHMTGSVDSSHDSRAQRQRRGAELRDRTTDAANAERLLHAVEDRNESDVEIMRQTVFLDGLKVLNEQCGEADQGVWEFDAGVFHRNPRFSFREGLWKLRWKDRGAWETVSPSTSGNTTAVQRLLHDLGELNERIGIRAQTNASALVELEYRDEPLVVSTVPGAETTVHGDRVELWLPGSGYFFAEVDPGDRTRELWDSDAHCESVGQQVGPTNTQWLALRAGSNTALIAIWQPKGAPNWVWSADERRQFRPLCYVRLVR